MSEVPDPKHTQRTIRRSIAVWSVLGVFMLAFAVAGFFAPEELANANVKTTPMMLTIAGIHGTLLLLAAVGSLGRNQIAIAISIILILLAFAYPLSFRSTFGAIVVGIVAVNAIACFWMVRTTALSNDTESPAV